MPSRVNTHFASFCATLDTNGGHIIVCITVILLGAAFAALRIPKSEDLIIAGSSTLFLAMRGNGAENHDTAAPQSVRVTAGGEPSKQPPSAISAETIQRVDIAPQPASK